MYSLWFKDEATDTWDFRYFGSKRKAEEFLALCDKEIQKDENGKPIISLIDLAKVEARKHG